MGAVPETRRDLPVGGENSQASTDSPSLSDGFAGGGEVGALMRQVDWSATPLGPVETWPQSFQTVVRILLTSRFAMWMGWGPDLTFFYNDTYGRVTLARSIPGRSASRHAKLARNLGRHQPAHSGRPRRRSRYLG